MGPHERFAPAAILPRARAYLERCVRIDTRSLAVFRVFVGLLIVADLLLRSRNFAFFYTESGVVPRSLAMELSADYAFSFYHLSTDSRVIAALFVLQGLIALQLIVGYRTRIATVLSFLFVISLDHHNPLVLSYADTLFRLLLFWAIFLPLGERWSVDAVHRTEQPREYVANAASALILLQMVFMYVSNGVIKSLSGVWVGGSAAPLVLGLDEITFLIGNFVRNFSTLLAYGGLAWYYMLLFAWLLILLRGRWRLLFLSTFVIGHLAFALTVRIGAFPYVALAGLIPFLQAQFWNDLESLARYAGIDVDRLTTSLRRLEALAAYFPRSRWHSERAALIRSRTYTLSIGVIVATIAFVALVLSVQVAAVVYEGGTGEQPIEEAIDETIGETLAETAGVRHVETVAGSLGIRQPIGWGIFAPHPRTQDRYYVFPAETVDGERLDVYNDRPLTYDRPGDQLQKQYGTYRERFYMNSVRRGGYHNDAPVILADYLCDTWSDERGVELTHVNMYMVGERVTLETIDTPEERARTHVEIYRHGCDGAVPKDIEPPWMLEHSEPGT